MVSGAVIAARELWFRPPQPPLPEFPQPDKFASMFTKVRMELVNQTKAWAFYLRHYPYRFRLVSVFIGGSLGGISYLLSENAYNRATAPPAGAATAAATAAATQPQATVAAQTQPVAPVVVAVPAGSTAATADAAPAPSSQRSTTSSGDDAANTRSGRTTSAAASERLDSGAAASMDEPEYTEETAAATALAIARGVAAAGRMHQHRQQPRSDNNVTGTGTGEHNEEAGDVIRDPGSLSAEGEEDSGRWMEGGAGSCESRVVPHHTGFAAPAGATGMGPGQQPLR